LPPPWPCPAIGCGMGQSDRAKLGLPLIGQQRLKAAD
jgi:hypothetical protein